ncbi:MAG: HAMP domain-containing sensor histidine kinase [Spirosomataceae bacterium]
MKCIYLIVFFAFSFQVPLRAQGESSFDSLKAAFSKVASDTARLRMLFAEKPMKYLSDSDELLKLYRQGYLIAKRQNDNVARFKAVYYAALTYMYGKVDETKAYMWLQEALVEAKATKNNLFIGWVYYAIGIIHHHQGNRAEMYKALYQSVGFLEKAPDPVVGPFVSLSQNLEDDKKWKEQLNINKRMVALMERKKGAVGDLLTAYNSLADALKHFPEDKQELAYYRRKTLALLTGVSVSNTDSDELLIISSIYYKYNRIDLAVKYAQQVADWGGKDRDKPNQGLAHKFLSDLYEEQKEYHLALKHLRQYQLIEIGLIEQRLNDNAGKKIIKVQAERDLGIKQAEVDRQQLYTYLAIAIAGAVILLSISIFYIYRREQARKTEFQHLNATKDKLFAILSHDLRSPVGNLENNVMLTHWGALSQEEFTKSTQSLGQEISQLRTMLDNVLQWSMSQMEGIKPLKEQFYLLSVLESQIQLLSPASSAKSIRIINTVSADTTLVADKNHLAVIFRNLLQNAIKFTPSGGYIQVKATQQSNHVRIEVSDTGIGMTKERVAHLFQLDSSASRLGTAMEQGTGLGLVLVKELVEVNGGSIQVMSEVNRGTAFVLGFQK